MSPWSKLYEALKAKKQAEIDAERLKRMNKVVNAEGSAIVKPKGKRKWSEDAKEEW